MSSSSLSSSQVAVSTPAPTRTKRVYRYLDGGSQQLQKGNSSAEPRDGASTPPSLSSPPVSSTAAGGIAGPSDGIERREKRAKVGRACLYCKRSHMACEDKRPCFRCVSRGIDSLCLDDDAHANTNATLHQGSTAGTSTDVLDVGVSPHQANEEMPNGVMDLNLNHILAAFEGSSGSFPRIDLPLDWVDLHGQSQERPTSSRAQFASPDAGPDLSPDSNTGARREIVGSQSGQPLILESLPDHPGHECRRRARPWAHILNTTFNAEDSELRPYNYAYGYQRIRRWTGSSVSGWSAKGVERVHSLLQEEIRPRLRARWQRLSDLQLVEEEQRFLAVVDHMRHNVNEAIDVPLVVLRRTWEIVCANEAWASLCRMDISCFDSGRLCLYQLLSEDLAVQTFERYADFVLRDVKKPLVGSGHVQFSRQRSREGDVVSVQVPVKISLEPVMDHNGLPVCHIATFSVL